jgi:colanic acid/amylovoran biosynthesis glycosyltransferase
MTYPLAVCVPVVGQPSETFIRRHVNDLLPGAVVVIARRPAPPHLANWHTDAPTLWLDDLADEWGGVQEQAAVAEFIEAHGVRSVLLEYLDIWLPFLSTLTQAGTQCIAHAHGYDVSMRLRDEHWRSAYRAYDDIDGVITMSNHSRERLVDIGLTGDRVHVVPYGVDVGPLAAGVADEQTTNVLVAGRLVAKKNPLATLEACARAASAGAAIRVTVIGDGPLLGEMGTMAESMPVPVEIRGARPHRDVLAAMRTADVFCQHSVVDPATGDEEGLPVAILEAMAHGLPVVSTRHAGIPEAVLDAVNGFLVEEGDVDGMAERLCALAADPALRQQFGAAGRERVRSRFSWAGERDELLRLLRVGEHVAYAGKGALR